MSLFSTTGASVALNSFLPTPSRRVVSADASDLLSGPVNLSSADLDDQMSAGASLSSSPLDYELQMTRFVVQRILTPVVVSAGVIGNVLNIAVLTRRWMKSSTNRYLTALAFCDVAYLLLAFTLR